MGILTRLNNTWRNRALSKLVSDAPIYLWDYIWALGVPFLGAVILTILGWIFYSYVKHEPSEPFFKFPSLSGPMDPREKTAMKLGVLLCCIVFGLAFYGEYMNYNHPRLIVDQVKVFECFTALDGQGKIYTAVTTWGKGFMHFPGNHTALWSSGVTYNISYYCYERLGFHCELVSIQEVKPS